MMGAGDSHIKEIKHMTKLHSNGTQQISTTRARVLIPVSGRSAAKIESAGGMDFLVSEVLEGATIKEIARTLGVPRSDLTSWQINQNDARYTAAMHASAESCLDRAEEVLDLPADCSAAQASLARERSSIWRHRAAVRDARYSAKAAAIELTAPATPAAMPSFTIKIVSASGSSGSSEREVYDADLHDPD